MGWAQYISNATLEIFNSIQFPSGVRINYIINSFLITTMQFSLSN